MGISLQKEAGQEIVHHRSLLGYCWNGREELREEQQFLDEWELQRRVTEKKIEESAKSINPDFNIPVSLPRSSPGALYPSAWMAVSDSTMALQTKKVCFTLHAFDESKREQKRKKRKKSGTSGGGGAGNVGGGTASLAGSVASPGAGDTQAGSPVRIPSTISGLSGQHFPVNARGGMAVGEDGGVSHVGMGMPDVSFTTSFTQALTGELRGTHNREGSWAAASRASSGGIVEGPSTTKRPPEGTGGSTDRAGGLHLKKMQNSNNYRHFAVELFNSHHYLQKHRMGVLKDVYFRIAPARRRYDHVVLKGFPLYYPPPGGDGENAPPPIASPFMSACAAGSSAFDDPKVNRPKLPPPRPQPLHPKCLTALLLVASCGYNSLRLEHHLHTVLAPHRPISYPLVDRDSPHVMATQSPVILYSISALELLLMPREAEICFGSWFHVSLEDERKRVIAALEVLVERLEELARYRLPPELVADNAMEALNVPWATHLSDYFEREADLKEKLYYRQRLKEIHVKPKKAAAMARNGRCAWRYEELWFPFAFMVVALPMYGCGVLPTAFHQHTTKSKPVSLHLRHPMSRSMFGVGVITAVRYGGLLVHEHRGKVGREDLKWLQHLLSLVQAHERKHPAADLGGERVKSTNVAMKGGKVEDAEDGGATLGRAKGVSSAVFNNASAPQFSTHRRRSMSAIGGKGTTSFMYSEDEDCVQSFRRAYQPVLDLMVVAKQRIQKRLRRRRFPVAMAHTRLAARLFRVELEHGGGGGARRNSGRPPSYWVGLDRTPRAVLAPQRRASGLHRRTASTATTTGDVLDDDSLQDWPIDEGSFASTASSSSSSSSDQDEEEEEERQSRSSITESFTEENNVNNTSMTASMSRSDLFDRGSTMLTESRPATPGINNTSMRIPGGGGATVRPTSEQQLKKKREKMHSLRTIRGAIRQMGGMQCLDVRKAMLHGVRLHTLENAVYSWVRNLQRAPIRARPLSIYLQRYEGICQAVRIGSTEIVYHDVPAEPDTQQGSFRGSFFGGGVVMGGSTIGLLGGPIVDGSMAAGTAPGMELQNMTFNYGSFRMGNNNSFAGNTNTRDELEQGMANIVGGAATAAAAAAEAAHNWHGSARGLPFVTTYSGALDPEVAPNLAPALDRMLRLYHLFDPSTSTCLLTELKVLHEQRNLPFHHAGPGVDQEWLVADRTLRNLKAELEEVEDLLHESQNEMLDRLEEYHNLSDLFLPHTRMDQVTSHMVYMKMMRQNADSIPVKEITQDWMNSLLAVLTIPYEEMFLVDQLQGPSMQKECVFKRYATYMPCASTPNNNFMDVCEANRLQLGANHGVPSFMQMQLGVNNSGGSPTMGAGRPTVEYKLVSPPAVITGAFSAAATASASAWSPHGPSAGYGSATIRRRHCSPLTPSGGGGGPPVLPGPKSVREVVIAPVPFPLAAEAREQLAHHRHATDYLPRASLFTGGSLGLLAGVLTLYADRLRDRAAARRTSFEEFVASGEDVFLQRLVIWGARGGGHSYGAGRRLLKSFSCCGGGTEDVVVDEPPPPSALVPPLSTASSPSSPIRPGGTFGELRAGRSPRAGRRRSITQLREGYESVMPQSPLHHHAGGASTTSLTTRGGGGGGGGTGGDGDRTSEEELMHHWKGAPFTTTEMFALFDAVEYYLTTLRELRQMYGATPAFVAQKPKKSKSWLQRLFGGSNSNEQRHRRHRRGDGGGSSRLQTPEPTGTRNDPFALTDTRPPSLQQEEGSVSPSREPMPGDDRGTHAPLHVNTGHQQYGIDPIRHRRGTGAAAVPSFDTFELCVGSNYYYHEIVQHAVSSDKKGGKDDHESDEDQDADEEQEEQQQADHQQAQVAEAEAEAAAAIAAAGANGLSTHPSHQGAGLSLTPDMPPLRDRRHRSNTVVHFNFGKTVTPKEWRQRAQLERPYTGGEEEDEAAKHRHQRYMHHQTRALAEGMEKALEKWKEQKKAMARAAEMLWDEEEFDKMIKIRQV